MARGSAKKRQRQGKPAPQPARRGPAAPSFADLPVDALLCVARELSTSAKATMRTTCRLATQCLPRALWLPAAWLACGL